MENNIDALENLRLKEALAAAQRRIRELESGSPAKNGHDSSSGATVTLVSGSEIAPIAIRWLWHGWLAEGKLEILAGAVATGKTTIAIKLAATITSGGRWLDEPRPRLATCWSGVAKTIRRTPYCRGSWPLAGFVSASTS